MSRAEHSRPRRAGRRFESDEADCGYDELHCPEADDDEERGGVDAVTDADWFPLIDPT